MKLSGIAAAAVLAWPFLEIAGFVLVGREVGVLGTILLVLAGVILGAALVRASGLRLVAGVRAELAAGRMPTGEIVAGAMTAVAGVLFIVPGFLSDLVAVLLLIPPIQRVIARRLAGSVTVVRTGPPARGPGGVVDLDPAEFERRPDPASPWRNDADPPALDGR